MTSLYGQLEGHDDAFATLPPNSDDEYFQTIDDHLKRLKFRDGTLISAALGKGNKGVGYVLRAPSNTKRSWKNASVSDHARRTTPDSSA